MKFPQMTLETYWAAYTALLVVLFVVGEWYALGHDGMTLSQFIRKLAANWPPVIFVAGVLASHLFWTKGDAG